MKKSLIAYIIVAVIVVLHLIAFCMLKRSAAPEKPVEENPPAQEQTASGTPSAQPPASPSGVPGKSASTNPPPSVPAPAAPATPAPQVPATAGMPGPYYNGFFKVGEKALPDKLKRTVAPVRSGLVIDLDTNTILWQKDAAVVHPIASLTKLLTALMLMEHFEAHPDQSLKTQITITAADRKYFKNHSINGVYLDANEKYSLDEMLMCMMVASSNDCAYVVGEYLAGGDAEKFPAMMNARAKALGLNDMKFNNANGLPVNASSGRLENTGSALDIAYLGVRAMRYPGIMKWAGTTSGRLRADKKNPFDVNSTNHLLRGKVPGVTGLKTGYTDGAGYCIVVTCERNNKKRMVVAMGVNANGTDRGKLRDEIVKQLLEWSYTL